MPVFTIRFTWRGTRQGFDFSCFLTSFLFFSFLPCLQLKAGGPLRPRWGFWPCSLVYIVHCTAHWIREISPRFPRQARRKEKPYTDSQWYVFPSHKRYCCSPWMSACASFTLCGDPDRSAIVQIQNQGSQRKRCFESKMVFYAVLSSRAPHMVEFFICKKCSGDLLNNWRGRNRWIFLPTCMHAIKERRESQIIVI